MFVHSFNGNALTKIDSLCLNHSIEFVFTQFSSRGALKFVFKISFFFWRNKLRKAHRSHAGQKGIHNAF